MPSSVELPLVSDRLACAGVLSQDVSRVKYVSGAREEALRRLHVQTVGDLLYHIPRRYLDFSHAYTIEAAPLGQVCTVRGAVDRVQLKRPRPKMSVVEVYIVDETGVLELAFFKQPWIAEQLKVGDVLAVMGKVEFNFGFKQMASPTFEKLDEGMTGSVMPVHPATEGLSPAWMRRILSAALEGAVDLPDPLPAKLRSDRSLMPIARALRSIHFPSSLDEVEPARRRLAYDEVLYLQLALRLRNDANLIDVVPYSHAVDGAYKTRLMDAMPFELSDEQQAAAEDILADMADSSRVMNRLLLGDVGTGKTAVACVALAAVADTGTQACVMAPTGVLAQQYSVSCGPLLDAAGISWALLTGSTPEAERASIYSRALSGELTVLFGTHAVLNEDVRFAALSLAVIDEQHRFGVGQRAALRAKGPGADLLVMSATPIPRTLALSVYGDLDTSIIRHRPVPGAGVSTKVLDDANRDIAYGAVREALEQGRQAYVICPLVAEKDDDEELDDVPALERDDEGKIKQQVPLHAAVSEVEHLRQIYPQARVEVLHGRMPAREKDRVIGEFRAGTIDILVSTTVVEVGVDVPNATVMLIENGERFGLATLHQLRGRVGRGKLAGTCYVLSALKKPRGRRSPALERLQALEHTSDGFELAEMDLRLRHEGEILGLRQHGGVSLRFVDLETDTDLIEAAHEDADELLRYARTLNSTATLPMRYEVVSRYGDIFKEVSGG